MAENKVVALNLGPVTSYGLAKSKGFPGTEEAWVEKLMANATEEAVEAVDDKVDALDAKVDTQVETINATIEQEVGAVDTKADGIDANLTTLSGVVAQKMDTTVAQASFVPVPSASGAQGDALRNNGDGTTAWAPIGLPTDEQTSTAINAWLTAHPEATTTVQDGAITRAKLITDLQEKTDLAQNATAPAFDATVAYTPGAHVTYGGKLYVLPSGHEANVTWADTTKNEVNLGGEVADLKSAFDDVGVWSYGISVKQDTAIQRTVTYPVNIKSGETYIYRIDGSSGVLSAYSIYSGETLIASNRVVNTEYEQTAGADITSVGLYVNRNAALSDGNVTLIVKKTDHTLQTEIDELKDAVAIESNRQDDTEQMLSEIATSNVLQYIGQKIYTSTAQYVNETICRVDAPAVNSWYGLYINNITGTVYENYIQIEQYNASDARIAISQTRTTWGTNGAYIKAKIIDGCSYVKFILYPTTSGGLSEDSPAVYSGIYITNNVESPTRIAKADPTIIAYTDLFKNDYYYPEYVYIEAENYTRVTITNAGAETATSKALTSSANLITSDYLSAIVNSGYGLCLAGWYNNDFLGFYGDGVFVATASYTDTVNIAGAFAAGANIVRLILVKTDNSTVYPANATNIVYTKRTAYNITNVQAIATAANNPNVKAIAHRGLSSLAPENTIPSFVLAKKYGFQYAETDLQKTSDGHYVCVHDSTLSRVTWGVLTGHVADYTLAELQAVSFGTYKGPQWTSVTVLTFEEFIDLCAAIQMTPVIELKVSDSFNADIPSLVGYVHGAGIDNAFWITNATYASAVRTADPSAIVVSVGDTFTDAQIANFAQFVINNDKNTAMIDCNYTGITDALIQSCRNHNISLGAWTVNTQADLITLLKKGISIITSDILPAGVSSLEYYLNML